MYALSLDVGAITGFCVAEIHALKAPRIMFAGEHENPERLEECLHLPASAGQPFVDRVIVEYPFVHTHSTTHKLMMELRNDVSRFLQEKQPYCDYLLLEVRPTDWKSTPAGKINAFRLPGNESWTKTGIEDSKHARDAAAILYWYSFWKLAGE